MRFKKIKFDNYRCFLNGEIEFCEKDGKNINLILGNNGAGKTEVLFAFWWLLYGFNFKQNKLIMMVLSSVCLKICILRMMKTD